MVSDLLFEKVFNKNFNGGELFSATLLFSAGKKIFLF